MLSFFLIRLFSENRQVNFIKKRGLILDSRSRQGRQVFLYNYGDLFAEIVYRNDNPEEPAEDLVLVNGLKNLKKHLEKEYRSA